MSNIAGSDLLAIGRKGDEVRSVPITGRLIVDHGLAAWEALIDGRAMVTAHLWLVDDLLASEAEQQVLPDFTLSSVPLSILFVPARARIARVRLLIDALATFLHKLPGIHNQP